MRELAVGLHRERAVLRRRACPAGRFTLRVLHRGVYFIDANLPRGQRLRIKLDAHRVFLRTEHLHLRHALDHRNALRSSVSAYLSTV